MKNLLFLSTFLLVGLAQGQNLHFVSSTPVANDNAVVRNANINLVFDANVDGATANANNIIITGSQTGLIAGTFSGGGTSTIVFDPTNDFKPGEKISITLTVGLTNITGNPLAAANQFEFHVAPDSLIQPIVYTPQNISTSVDSAQDVYAVDMDGDGDMDALSASFFGNKIVWHENNGTQSFTAHTITSNANFAKSVYATDMDGDGDMDALSASVFDDKIAWYENDGAQNFTAHSIASNAYGARSVHAADMDNDGDMDALSASSGDDKIAWYENDGAQNFTAHAITTTADFAQSVFAVDMDGDGDMDALSASLLDDKIAWYENDGSQNFTAHNITVLALDAQSVFAADMDGDGDMDALSASFSDDKIAWYENDGNQNFTAYTIAATADAARDVSAADMDGDGDIDAMSASQGDDKIAWYENDGSQNFTAHDITTSAKGANSVYAADMDGDGDMDALSASPDDDKIAWYASSALLHLTTSTPAANAIAAPRNTNISLVFDATVDATTVNATNIIITGSQTGLVPGSFSGGGTSTIVFDPISDFKPGETIKVTLTDGLSSTTGQALSPTEQFEFRAAPGPLALPIGYTPQTIASFTDNFPFDVYAADMDGDGDMDALSANGGNPFNPPDGDDTVFWYENDGNQIFNSHAITTSVLTCRSVHATDMDGDGDMDALSASSGDDKIAWHENNGSQIFTAHVISLVADGAWDVYAVDMDGDGDMDAMSASSFDNKIAWYENSGKLNFMVHTISTSINNPFDVHAADMEGDGDMDAFGVGPLGLVWYENDGSQNFTAHSISGIFSNAPVHVVDMDGDMDMDILNGSSNDEIVWFENDGAQNFSVHSITTSAYSLKDIHAADMDGDGDMDVLGACAVDDKIAWYENDGAQSFTAHRITTYADGAFSVHAADMDGDGDMDALSTAPVYDEIAWYEFTPVSCTFGSKGYIAYVDENATGTADGGSWANAYPTLSEALYVAKLCPDITEIRVAQGIYYPTSLDDPHIAFEIPGGVKVKGGYDATTGNRDPSQFVSILSGLINPAPIFPLHSFHVVKIDDPQSPVVLEGFTISNGRGGVIEEYNHGAGIFVVSGGGNVLLNQLKITSNESNNEGSGIAFFGNDEAKTANTPTVVNTLITNNTSFNSGPVYAHSGVTANFINVTIANNSNLTGSGDNAINVYKDATVNLKNSIVFGNTGGNRVFDYTGTDSLEINLFSTLTDAQVGVDDFNDNGNNVFTPTSPFTNMAGNDYTLASLSLANDAGKNVYYSSGQTPDISNITVDLVSNQRIQGTVDMGAYENSEIFSTFIYNDNAWLMPLGDPNGVATGTDNVLVLSDSASFVQDMQINDLSVVENATLNIEQALTINGNIENNGSLVFINDATKLGQLDVMTGSSISGSGSVTVQRHIPARDADVVTGDINGAYRYIVSAVNSTSSIHANWQEGATGIGDNPNPGYGIFITGSPTGANGFDQTAAGAPSMFGWDGNAQNYVAVPNTDVDNLVAGVPYVTYIWGDRGVDIVNSNDPPATNTTLRATGDLVVGDKTFNGLSPVSNTFNLVGNPYQAIVDMNDVLANSTNLNTAFYYVWDPNLGTRGAYALVILGTGTTTPSTSEANQYLMPGQAAFVLTANNQATSILFEESDKDVSQTPTDVFKPQNTASIELQLFQEQSFNNGGPLSDAAMLNFSAGESNAVQQNDAPKLWNFDENLCRANGSSYLAFENRAMPTNGESLQLHNSQYRVENYVYKAFIKGMPKNFTAYLKDDYLGIQTKLANNSETLINFSIDASIPSSIAPDRFSIVFAVNGFSTEDFTGETFTLYPNPVKDGTFFINAPGMAGEKVRVSLYDLLGRKVLESLKTIGADSRAEIKTGNLQAGIYMVKMENKGRGFSQKLIVE